MHISLLYEYLEDFLMREVKLVNLWHLAPFDQV